MTTRQRACYDLIAAFHREHGYAPTVLELAQAMGCSRSNVRQHLAALRRKGYVTWDTGVGRSLRIRRAIDDGQGEGPGVPAAS